MTIARTYALIIGWLLTVVGIVGFFTGSMLLIFEVNMAHNLVHVATGAVALLFGYWMSGRYARTFDQWLGVVYGLVTVFGFGVAGLGSASILGILPVNLADNVLHATIALGSLAVGFLSRREVVTAEEHAPRRAA